MPVSNSALLRIRVDHVGRRELLSGVRGALLPGADVARGRVLEHGRVVELGSHAELMAERGRYRTMFDLQAERFNDSEDEEGLAYDVLT